MAVAGSGLLLSGWPVGGDSRERGEARRQGDDPILRWPRRCAADAVGTCMTGHRRAGPGSHRKRSAGAVSGLMPPEIGLCRRRTFMLAAVVTEIDIRLAEG